MIRQQLASAQRAVDAFPSEWIEELGGIAYQRRTTSPRPPRGRCEWPGGPHRIHSFGGAEQLGDAGTLGDPALQKFGPVGGDLGGSRNRNHKGDVGESVADVRDSEISVAIHVHFPELT